MARVGLRDDRTASHPASDSRQTFRGKNSQSLAYNAPTHSKHRRPQLVGYLLIDIKRLGVGARTLVTGIERSIIDFLGKRGIQAMARKDAPGVYVAGRKIAALGLRVRKGCSYHGLSLNVDMDIAPFAGINPCGHEGLEVVDLKTLGMLMTVAQAAGELAPIIGVEFAYDALIHETS